MTVTGIRTLPCGHARMRPPQQIGHYHRHCTLCRTTFYFTVEPSRISDRVGTPLLHIRWET